MRGATRDFPRPNSRESNMNTLANDPEGALMANTNDPSEANRPRQDQVLISSSPAESLEIEVEFKPLDLNVILDWNEEIELSKREAAANGDAMTRSSSVASLQDVSSRSMPASASVATNARHKR